MAIASGPATLAEDYEIISEFDEYVERPREVKDENGKLTPECEKAFEEFAERWQRYLDGTEEPPLKPNANPTVFTLRHLGKRQLLNVNSDGAARGQYDWLYLACAYALVSARNLYGKDAVTRFEREIDKHECERVKLSELDKLPVEVALEIGRVAIAKSRSSSNPLS